MSGPQACEPCLQRARLGWAVAYGLLARRRRAPPWEIIGALSIDEAVARQAARRLGIRAPVLGGRGGPSLCRHLDGYPGTLTELPGSAPVLHLRAGAAMAIAGRWVAVAGPRHPSPYATAIARSLGRTLARCGVGVTGVLERGSVLEAMVAAHEAGGSVLGVQAGRLWDRETRLCSELGSRGLVISEWEGREAPAWAWVGAARIVAALAGLTVVVEAAGDGPALLLADLAQSAGREVAAVPGRIDSTAAAGSNRLLREGAHVITEVTDVLDLMLGASWGHSGPGLARPSPAPLS